MPESLRPFAPHHPPRVAAVAVAVASALGIWCAAGLAQSPTPFGIPTAARPQPAADIDAVPGSRAQGWLAQGRSEVVARHGIVATSDPLASEAGLEILRRGGNAIDAAVATGAVLDVTSQNDTGIGGDLFALVYVAKDRKLYALNSAGWAPAGWTREFFTNTVGVKDMPLSGVNATTVPGAISGYDALLKRFGTLTFKETLERAARIAEEGWGQAERRHADLRSVRGAAACRRRFGGNLPDRRRGAAALQRAPQSRPGQGAAPAAAAGPRCLLHGRHRQGRRRQGEGRRRRDDARRSRRVPVGVGRSDLDELSRLRRVRAAAARAGLRRARDAEHPRGLRAEAGVEPVGARPVEPDLLAPAGRGEEARLRGSAGEERRPEVRHRAGRHADLQGARRVALQPPRPGHGGADRRAGRRRRRHRLPDHRRSLGQHGVADPQHLQRLWQQDHRAGVRLHPA